LPNTELQKNLEKNDLKILMKYSKNGNNFIKISDVFVSSSLKREEASSEKNATNVSGCN